MTATLDAPATVSVPTGMTLEEFYPWSQRDDAHYELVEGEVITKPMSARAFYVASTLNEIFVEWVQRTRTGK